MIFVQPSSVLRLADRSDAETQRVRNATNRDEPGSAPQPLVPLIALTVTVGLGITLGLWMVLLAVTAPSSQSASDHGHDDAQAPAHGHSDAGVVPMPGLDRVAAPTRSSASGDEHQPNSIGGSGMAGMNADEMAAMAGMTPVDPAATPTPSEPGSPMAGMSDEDMAAMGHAADEHTAVAADGKSGRPLAATLAGFALVNLAVLIGARVVGRRRARPSRRPRNARSHWSPDTGPGAAPVARSTAGSQS